MVETPSLSTLPLAGALGSNLGWALSRMHVFAVLVCLTIRISTGSAAMITSEAMFIKLRRQAQ